MVHNVNMSKMALFSTFEKWKRQYVDWRFNGEQAENVCMCVRVNSTTCGADLFAQKDISSRGISDVQIYPEGRRTSKIRYGCQCQLMGLLRCCAADKWRRLKRGGGVGGCGGP